MSLVSMDFESQLYGGRHMISVILPDLPRDRDPREFYPNNKKFKVLWLLHGTFGDCTDWVRRTNIELYATERNIAVVMPSAMNSDYVNWPGFGVGFNMYDYLFEELMPMIYNWFPVSDKREDNFIAGLSMGGGGAMVYALSRPEKFAAAGSLSCVPFQPDEYIEHSVAVPPAAAYLEKFRPNRFENQFKNLGGTEGYRRSVMNTWDLLVRNYEEHVDMPKLYFCDGQKDFLYKDYIAFKGFTEKQGYGDIIFEEDPDYGHEWRFWDKYIERFIELFMTDHRIDDEKIAF